MYYQFNKIYQQKQIFFNFLTYLVVFFIFFSPKINFFILSIQLRTDYIIYLTILFSTFFLSKSNLKKNDYILIICFFLLNFILSFYEASFKQFIKQFILVLIAYVSLKNYSKNFDENKFIDIYKKFGLIVIIVGYFIFALSFSQSVFFENIFIKPTKLNQFEIENFYNLSSTYKENYLIFLTEIFQIKNPGRFQSICSEPATFAILTSPLLYFYLNDIRNNKLKILLLVLSIVLSHSIYGILGLFLCILFKFRLNIITLVVFILFLLLILIMPGNKFKTLVGKSYTVINKGFNEKAWKEHILDLTNVYDSGSVAKRFESYNSIFYENFTEENKKKLLFYDTKYLIHPLNTSRKIKPETLENLIEKHDFHIFVVDENNIGSTSCAYLGNLFIAISNLKNFRFLGSGIGSNEIVYQNKIKNWIFMKSNSSDCLGLNYKDGKSYFIRVFTEFGILGLMLLLFLMVKIKNKNKDLEIFSKIIIFLLFLQLGNYGTFKLNIILLLLLKSSNLSYLFYKLKKNN